ncbi:hypothetical protein PVNG_05673 [Plasmodium vivax North Korean]|uniref:Variable surface protein n=1 Tax=Plasmodium vivax North Korean TaxID=1035514 RepID=A0A0J9TUE4_PLAVI|nr:hypothetical protein PVNG_05673 [Plasmodium vivax North Korean]
MKNIDIFFIIHMKEYHLICKALDNGNKVNISLDIRTNRLLAKHEYQNEIPSKGFQNKVSYNRDNYIFEKGKGNINTFQQLKQGRSNHVDNYLKSYKNRYSKKKGLSKLDCYCEKKVLEKIHDLYGVGEKLRKEKKSFQKFFLKKYGIGLILFALIPALSVIFSILFGVDNWWDGILVFCSDTTHVSEDKITKCSERHKFKWDPIVGQIKPVLMAFTFTMIIIIVLFTFYTLIKIIKYEKLKSGKDKMSLKEYCRFSKDVFI